MQQRMFRKAAISIAVMSLAACQDKPAGLNLTPPIPPPGEAATFVVNAVPDAPNLDVQYSDSAGRQFNGQHSKTLAMRSLAFGQGAGFGPAAGTGHMAVHELLASDNAVPPQVTQPLVSAVTSVKAYDVTAHFITGTHVNPTILTVTANGGAEGYGLGYADVVVADAAPVASVNFPGGFLYYLTDPTGFQQIFPPLPQAGLPLAFGVTWDPFLQLQGALLPTFTSYRLIVVDGTNPASVLFDSGSTVLQPPSGGPMILGLIDNPDYRPSIAGSTTNSPFRMFSSMSGKTTGDTAASTGETTNPAGSAARFVNAANAGGLDVSISNVTPAYAGFTNLPEGGTTAACGIVSNTVDTPTADSSVATFSVTGTNQYSLYFATGFTFASSNELFVAAGDTAAVFPAIDTLHTFAFKSDSRTVATEGRVRFVNASEATLSANSTGKVSVFITPAGAVTDGDVTSGSVTPSASVDYGQDPNAITYPHSTPGPFRDVTNNSQPYFSVAGGSYDVRVATKDAGASTYTIVTESTGMAIPAGASVTEVLTGSTPTLTTVDNTVAACP